MAEEQRTFCKYCNADYTNLEYGLHRLSNPHVKKIRVELLPCDFSCVCRVCKVSLKDLQDVEIHVQGQAHEDRFKFRLSTSYATNRCACELCGVIFHNEVALETHHLMPLHRNAASSYSFPKLNELLGQLSGLAGEHLALDMSSLCSICNVPHDGLDTYIMHLFASTHIAQLRFSSCLVCKKEFVHADNRESHLVGHKHLSNVQKCGNILKEGPTIPILMKGGYPCMFCMVWCSSWPCLELHLRYPSHGDAARRSKAKHSVLGSGKINFTILRDVKDDQNNACDVDATGRWREWRQNASKEHAWCHRCGVSLPTLDAANHHSEKHDLEKERLVVQKIAHAHEASDSFSVPDLFDCRVCALSFKSAFLLMAHEACFQHHCRMVKFPIINDLTCCASCGILASTEYEKVDACEELDVLQRCVNGTGHEAEGLCYNPARNGSGIDRINKDGCNLDVIKSGKDAHVLPALKRKSTSEIGNFAKIMASEETMKDRMLRFDPCCVKEERSPFECSNHATVKPLVFTGENRGKVKKDSDMMLTQRETDSKEDISQIKVSHVKVVPKTDNASHALPLVRTHVENGVQQDSRVPVIAVAALTPLGAFHQSLHSIMTIVVEALSATLPAYTQQSPSSSQEHMKHEHQGQEILEVHNQSKRVISEENMKETLHHILQSVRSKSVSVAMDAKSMDKTKTVLAVTASLAPKLLPDSICGSARGQGEANMVTETQQGLAKQGANQSCELVDKSIHIELCLDQGLEGNQCNSETFHVDHVQENSEKVMQVLPHDNDVVQQESTSLVKVNELPAITMDVGMPPLSIKVEKDDDHDGNDSYSIPKHFKDADLWWVLSDSEDVTDNESNFKL